MNKILIPLIIIIAVYIGYGKLTSENPSESANEPTLSTNEQPKEKIKIHHFEPEVVLPNVDVNPLLGDYSAKVENSKVTASLKLSLMEGQKIFHSRTINRQGTMSEGSVEGKYTIEGNILTFLFPENRDREVFPMEMLILTIAEDNGISSGKVNFIKS